ncbi:MAG: NADP-dependent oxidoreductase [Bifidobacteriaceae bacterium]|jgi:NADPH:quinone reductase-like Zn-dependent oxidoreductase|nr:NADP-dependent oxidoreductase [Bifidobacteriaceae bacterium]MCI1978599.1 NADP-dependent oxidoreductase [Bifidobacteriaceae bacterium]
MMRIVRQVNYNGIDALHVTQTHEPTLTPMASMVKTAFVPVLPWDILTEQGKLRGMRPVRLPLVVGYGFSGTVTAVGALRSPDLVGQRVIGVNPGGAMQSLIASTLPPLLFKVPDNVALEDAVTLIGGADAAMTATNHLRVSSKDTVFVTGASGGVGTYLIQLLKKAGATVVALSAPQNMDFVRSLGADDVIDYTQNVASILRNSHAINKVIDTVGTTRLLEDIAAEMTEGDILSLSTTEFPRHTSRQRFQFSNGSIGLGGYKQLLNWLSDGTLRAVVQEIFPAERTIEAQQTLVNGHAQGRILVEF